MKKYELQIKSALLILAVTTFIFAFKNNKPNTQAKANQHVTQELNETSQHQNINTETK